MLGVERGGVYRSVAGFEYEVVGQAIDSALAAYHRALSFPRSRHAADRVQAAQATLESPSISTAPIDSLIVALKCHQTLPCLRQIAHRLRPDSCIVLVQNGMGVYDQLCTDVWPDPRNRPQFILASTTHGARAAVRTPVALRGGRFERAVVHTGSGDIALGVVPDPRGQVDYDRRLFPDGQPSLTRPGPSGHLPLPSLSPATDAPRTATPTPLEQTLSALLALEPLNPTLLPIPVMYQTLLLKLAVNCAINPLTGILAVLNGALVGSPHTQHLVTQILAESSAVITTYLAQLDRDSPLDPETIALFSPGALERRTAQVLTATARNTSSMATDMSRLGTPQGSGTEIQYITGFLVRLGERVGVPTPVNRALLELVEAREEIASVSPMMLVRPAGKSRGKR